MKPITEFDPRKYLEKDKSQECKRSRTKEQSSRLVFEYILFIPGFACYEAERANALPFLESLDLGWDVWVYKGCLCLDHGHLHAFLSLCSRKFTKQGF